MNTQTQQKSSINCYHGCLIRQGGIENSRCGYSELKGKPDFEPAVIGNPCLHPDFKGHIQNQPREKPSRLRNLIGKGAQVAGIFTLFGNAVADAIQRLQYPTQLSTTPLYITMGAIATIALGGFIQGVKH
jgi:hypothetical protein